MGESTAAQAQAGLATAPHGPAPLWRNIQFQTLWFGQAASTLGVTVADIAYPLAILALTGSSAKAGLFAALQAMGMLLAGLPGGAAADRYDGRVIVVVTEVARMLITCLVVAALVGGWLTLPLLLGTAALLGAGQGIGNPARRMQLRAVVPPQQLTAALTQDEVRVSGAALVGPALGGALYAVHALAHAVPFLFIAATFLAAAVTAAIAVTLPGGAAAASGPPAGASPNAEPASAPPADRRENGMLAGVRALWRLPALRAAMLLIMAVNTVGSGLDLVVIVLLRHQHVPAGTIGLALGCGAVGGLAGAPLVKWLHRIRPGVLLLAVGFQATGVIALLAVPFGAWWTGGLLFVSMLGVPALRVLIDILVLRQAPAEQRGRVIAAVMTLIGLGIPIGTSSCGLLLQYMPAQAAMLTLAAVLATGVGLCALSRALWRAHWPEPA